MKRSVILVLATLALLSLSSAAFAAEGEAKAADFLAIAVPLGAGFAIGIAALGGSLAQGNAVKGALEGIARNPGASGKIMTSMIVGLAFIESLVIYALLIAFMLMGKI